MNNMMHHHDHADRLRAAGMRATAPRLAILSFLEADRSHPTAEQIHAALGGELPSLSLSTVYSTIESFLQAGLLRRIQTPEGLLRVDGTVQDHDHAVCRQCGRVFDVMRRRATPTLEAADLPADLQLVDVHIEYEVICSACRGA